MEIAHLFQIKLQRVTAVSGSSASRWEYVFLLTWCGSSADADGMLSWWPSIFGKYKDGAGHHLLRFGWLTAFCELHCWHDGPWQGPLGVHRCETLWATHWALLGCRQTSEKGYKDWGTDQGVNRSKINFIASSFCSGLSWGAGVSLPLYAVQILLWSCLAAKINAPARQMNPRGIGASNHEKWWRL